MACRFIKACNNITASSPVAPCGACNTRVWLNSSTGPSIPANHRMIGVAGTDPMPSSTTSSASSVTVTVCARRATVCSTNTSRGRHARPAARARAFPHELSGGERQRVVIATAIANDPDLIICDEPTTALDVTVQAQILDVLRTARDVTGAGVLMITHDLGVVAEFADRAMVMYAGRAVETAPVANLYRDRVMPYTVGLLGSVPRLDAPQGSRLVPIPGAPPSMAGLPPGCPFAPRCPRVMPICMTSVPRLKTGPDGRAVACHLAEVETAMNRAAAG